MTRYISCDYTNVGLSDKSKAEEPLPTKIDAS